MPESDYSNLDSAIKKEIEGQRDAWEIISGFNKALKEASPLPETLEEIRNNCIKDGLRGPFIYYSATKIPGGNGGNAWVDELPGGPLQRQKRIIDNFRNPIFWPADDHFPTAKAYRLAGSWLQKMGWQHLCEHFMARGSRQPPIAADYQLSGSWTRKMKQYVELCDHFSPQWPCQSAPAAYRFSANELKRVRQNAEIYGHFVPHVADQLVRMYAKYEKFYKVLQLYFGQRRIARAYAELARKAGIEFEELRHL